MNTKNPAIKRIMADVRELEKHPSSRYWAEPLEENFFEWHFTIRGPTGSHFEGGMYHGRILLPAEYPFKPPNIVFMTRNGRFEVGTKICLSISAYHEESWQPAWGVRTMLEAIISFLPSEGAGAIGALDWSEKERKRLAIESQAYCCPVCGSIAAKMLDPRSDGNDEVSGDIAAQISQLRMQGSNGGGRSGDTPVPSGSSASTKPATPSGGGGGGTEAVDVGRGGDVALIGSPNFVDEARFDGEGDGGVGHGCDENGDVLLRRRPPPASPAPDGGSESILASSASVVGASAAQTRAPVAAPAGRDWVDVLLGAFLAMLGAIIVMLVLRKSMRGGSYPG